VFNTVETDIVDQAVFQEIDFGENCPGFGGNVAPITAVAVAGVFECVDACFRTFIRSLVTDSRSNESSMYPRDRVSIRKFMDL
jgi:hypothetical protein